MALQHIFSIGGSLRWHFVPFYVPSNMGAPPSLVHIKRLSPSPFSGPQWDLTKVGVLGILIIPGNFQVNKVVVHTKLN